MGQALVYGAITAAALVVGALAGTRIRLPQRVLAMALAFAAGSLITALAFELFEESYQQGGGLVAGLGFGAGAVVFTVISAWLDRQVEHPADVAGSPKVDTAAAATEPEFSPSQAGSQAGLALLAAAALDGIPENIALGVALADEHGRGGAVLLVAIFLSNLPEALVGSASMKERGWSTARAVGIWCGASVVIGAAVLLGRGLLADIGGAGISLPLAFAAGAVVASLADTFMPEAYEKGGPAAALATAAGFMLSYLLSVV
jgi:ZIP family zinc transporter